MKFLLGTIAIIISIVFSYTAMGGKLSVLWQPGEFGIIFGTTLGAFIISNPNFVIVEILKSLGTLFRPIPHNQDSYVQLLSFLHEFFKNIKAKGFLSIENDLERPYQSTIFNKYPKFIKNSNAVTYFCDYMRIITMGLENHYQIEELMLQEKENSNHYKESVVNSISSMADSMPALGIVAAVLGVIKTMGHVSDPPEILGKSIAGALVGTFLGVLFSYAFIGPISNYLSKSFKADSDFIECIKISLISYLQGNSPTVIIEFARKSIQENLRPSFEELEKKINT